MSEIKIRRAEKRDTRCVRLGRAAFAILVS